MSNNVETFNGLEEIASKFRSSDKKVQLLFAHNGIGKTRLSMFFKELGKNGNSSDTLYFNAFTEDLFHWDNKTRVLQLKKSKFFSLLDGMGLKMETYVGDVLNYYADFDFKILPIKLKKGEVSIFSHKIIFSCKVIQDGKGETAENIKISRGEENIFIWSFFLAIVEITLDSTIDIYNWVKYIYIDDPISSLDDNNVIIVASHLAKKIKESKDTKFIISTHHGLFYNVIFNELRGADKYLLLKDSENNNYKLKTLTSDTPYYQHIGLLKDLHKIAQSGEIYTYHFNLLRNILEKTAAFHGFNKFSDCIKVEGDDIDKISHARRINILSHGNYSIFEPQVMQDENKEHFKNILANLIKEYKFSLDKTEENK